MKALLIGTDFVKDTDGSYKVLEVNTNIHFTFKDASKYLDIDSAFGSILSGSGITEAHLVFQTLGNSAGVQDLQSPTMTSSSLAYDLVEYLTSSNLTITEHIGSNGVVPYVEDGDNKLIIRQAYDQTAIFDTDYARDNYKFLKLMNDNDSTSIPKTFVPNTGSAASFSFDTIGSSFRDNGDYPNYLIKKRYPTTDYGTYPKIFKVADSSELSALKNTIEDGEFLQEYIINSGSTVEGKLANYRSIDLIYGSDLSSVNLGKGFVLTNTDIFSGSVDYDDDNQIQIWERGRFLHKIADYQGRTPNVVGNARLLSGSVNISGSDAAVGNKLSTVNIPDLPDENAQLVEWTGSYTNLTDNFALIDTVVQSAVATSHVVMQAILTTDNGLKVILPASANILLEKDGITSFERVHEDFDTTDYSLVYYDNSTNEVAKESIATLSYGWASEGGSHIEVEADDTFLVEDAHDSNKFMITHNLCRPTTFYGFGYCQACGPNSLYSVKGGTHCCSYYYGSAFAGFSPYCTYVK